MMRKGERIAELAGIIAPLLFVAVFTLVGSLRSDYNSFEMYISALSLGPQGRIQIANFMLLGVLLLYFTTTFTSLYNFGKASKIGFLLTFLSSMLFFFSGPFVMDPVGAPSTLPGIIHTALGSIIFLLIPTSCFVFFRRFHKDAKRKYLQWVTLLVAVVVSCALILLIIATKFPSLQSYFVSWVGLIQRVIIIPYMFWLSTFAFGVYKKNRSWTLF